jgi:hypothetical protein
MLVNCGGCRRKQGTISAQIWRDGGRTQKTSGRVVSIRAMIGAMYYPALSLEPAWLVMRCMGYGICRQDKKDIQNFFWGT